MKNTTKLWILSAFLILFNIFVYLLKPGGETALLYVSDLLPVICAFIATLSLYSAYKKFKNFDFVKIAWLMLLTGIFLYLLAESTYAYSEIILKTDMNSYFPSKADFFWCTGYMPILTGLFMMFGGYKRSGFPIGNVKIYGILSLLIIFLSITVFYFLLKPIMNDPETDIISKTFYLFYPVADVLLVIPALILMYITSLFGGGTISTPWKLLAFGFMSFTVADLLYSYLSWEDSYGSGNLIDVAWHLGYLLIAQAGLYQKQLIDGITEEES